MGTNDNDKEVMFDIHIQIASIQPDLERYFTKVATKKKLIYYCAHPNYEEAKKDYDRLLHVYGFED
jgi:hypothetical protein